MLKIYTTLVAVLITLMASAQTVTIYTQDFGDANNLVFPTGWNSTDNGWYVDNTNISQGYDNATGQANMAIKNTSPTGPYYLTTGPIETTGYENIRVLWGRRISNNYLTYSSLPVFEFSIDGGNNWVNIAYYDTFENNSWALTNAGDDITVSSLADDKAAVRFRWLVNITNNPDGTYRMDDFRIKADVKQTGVGITSAIKQFEIIPVNNALLVLNNSSENAVLNIFDLQGRRVMSSTLANYTQTIPLNELTAGVYVTVLQNSEAVLTKKIVITK